MTTNAITHTMTMHGIVRNAEGSVVAVYDCQKGILHLNGHVLPISVSDEFQVMDIVGSMNLN